MKKEEPYDGVERRAHSRRGRKAPQQSKVREEAINGLENEMIKKKTRPDFTRAETYMREHVPSVAERTRADVENQKAHDLAVAAHALQRRRGMQVAMAFLAASIGLMLASDMYGSIVDGIAGVVAAFAIAATIHFLKPKPILRFGLVIIALACLAVTFGTVLHIHLYGIN